MTRTSNLSFYCYISVNYAKECGILELCSRYCNIVVAAMPSFGEIEQQLLLYLWEPRATDYKLLYLSFSVGKLCLHYNLLWDRYIYYINFVVDLLCTFELTPYVMWHMWLWNNLSNAKHDIKYRVYDSIPFRK